jgi:uncharacterized protein (DUF2062 family)/2-polyprenyl-3-methyl-5-hydroxy-6-metoxy-1,4-benzoquinol methylase
LARFSPFREELRRAAWELRGADLSPLRGAAAVAIGLFIGSQPIFGCHTPLVLGLCLWLRLDFAIAWIAANISNPFFAPALLTAEVQVGAYLRTGALLKFDQDISRAGALSAFAGDLFLGALPVGLSLAAVGAGLTYAGITLKRRFRPSKGKRAPYRLPPDAPPWMLAVERVAGRYAPPDGGTATDRSRFHYVRTKLLSDPVAKLVAGIAGDAEGALGDIADIGTGRGQLPILLIELGRAARAWGVDWDAKKIEAAQRAVAGDGGEHPPLDATFVAGDAREADVPAADTVLLIDLLHYFTIAEQDGILRRAARAVRPGGRILIREADTERGLRSIATLLEERIFTAIRFNRGERVKFRPAREIAARLEEAGLSVTIQPAWERTPFSNVLVIGRRPPADSPSP